jgi:hypothetical protein
MSEISTVTITPAGIVFSSETPESLKSGTTKVYIYIYMDVTVLCKV